MKKSGYNIAVVMGTRPEVIKLAPIVRELKKDKELNTQLISTAQHKELLVPLFDHFQLQPDISLNVMKPDQSPQDVASRVIDRLDKLIIREKPDAIMVQGDTTTVFAAAFTAAYHKLPVFHVEAGLRTDELYDPFPEEINRRLTGRLATLHFAATDRARLNLLAEGISNDSVIVTGNTVIDSLLWTVDKNRGSADILPPAKDCYDKTRPLIVLTAHRRENFGEPLRNIFKAIKKIAAHRLKPRIVYPVHPNPKVLEPARQILSGTEGVELIEPLGYADFARLLSKARLIMTDSGGIQEEAPALDIPVIVLRRTTERPEAVECGAAILAGTETENITKQTILLLENDDFHRKMSTAPSPFGDGKSSARIVKACKDWLIRHHAPFPR